MSFYSYITSHTDWRPCSYYHEWGGQGWLKSRAQTQNLKAADVQEVYLPLRKVEIRKDDTLRFEWNRGSMGSVPFYVCGDQQSSCEAYNQPVSTPPVRGTASELTSSGYLLSCADDLSSDVFHAFRDILLQLNCSVL